MKPDGNPTSARKTDAEIEVPPNAGIFLAPTSGLQEFAPNVWIIEGPDVRDMGFMFTTRMTVVRLSDDSLWIDSPVPVPFETLRQLAGLGPIRYLVAATPRHVWRLDGWHTLFPEATLWACQPTPLTLQKGPLPFAGFLGDRPPEDWARDLDQHVFKGNPFSSEVFFFHRASHTLLLDDLIQIHSPGKNKPLLNFIFQLAGVLSPQGGVSIDIRLTFFHRALARKSLEKILSWDFDRLILAHGPCITREAKPFVERAFRWLAP
jgi:hypothetical protein